MKRAAALLCLLALAACAIVDDTDCRRTAEILGDPSHYRICLVQKGKV